MKYNRIFILQPRNIFISTSGQLQIQLGDFGLACPLKSQGKNHSACGTHMYAAPEQLQGKCDPKVNENENKKKPMNIKVNKVF